MGTHGSGYKTSVPFSTAFDPAGEVLIAWAMNGEPLPPEHGFPLRVLIPGVTGARSCKWLRRITVQSEETDHHMHKNYYKVLPPHILAPAGHKEEILATPPLYDININSVVFEPRTGTPATAGPLKLRGYAYCGGGRPVERVEVSLDGGVNWTQSTFLEQRRTPGGKCTRGFGGNRPWISIPRTTARSLFAHGTRTSTRSQKARSGTTMA